MTNDYWKDFIGEIWTVNTFLGWVEQHNAECDLNLTPGDYIELIVDSVYEDDDYWWLEPEERELLRAEYPDRDDVVQTLKVMVE